MDWPGHLEKNQPTLNSSETPVTLVGGEQRKIYFALVTIDNQASTDDIYAMQIPGEDKAVDAALLSNRNERVTEKGTSWMVPYILLSSA